MFLCGIVTLPGALPTLGRLIMVHSHLLSCLKIQYANCDFVMLTNSKAQSPTPQIGHQVVRWVGTGQVLDVWRHTLYQLYVFHLNVDFFLFPLFQTLLIITFYNLVLLLLPCYLVTMLPGYSLTQLPCYLVNLLPCYSVTYPELIQFQERTLLIESWTQIEFTLFNPFQLLQQTATQLLLCSRILVLKIQNEYQGSKFSISSCTSVQYVQ